MDVTPKEINNTTTFFNKVYSALNSFSTNKIDLEEFNKMNHYKKQDFTEIKNATISRRSLISYKNKQAEM